MPDGLARIRSRDKPGLGLDALLAAVVSETDSISADIRGFPDPSAIAAYRGLGFCAVHVEIRGIEADRRERLLTALEPHLGEPVATDHEGDWCLYSFDSQTR